MARKTFTLKQVLDEVLLNSDSDYDPELEDSSNDRIETEVSQHTQQSVTTLQQSCSTSTQPSCSNSRQPSCSNSRQSRQGGREGGHDSSSTPEEWSDRDRNPECVPFSGVKKLLLNVQKDAEPLSYFTHFVDTEDCHVCPVDKQVCPAVC